MLITGPIDLRHAALQRLALGALPRVMAATIEPVPPVPTVASQLQAQPSVAMLVAMSASDPKMQRQRITAAANKGLRALEALHADLCIGPPSPAQLVAIAAWMTDHPVPEEPAAADLLRQVELRVLVELAKADRDR